MGDTSSEEDEKEKEVKNYFVITFIIIIIIITLQAIVFVVIEIIEFIILMVLGGRAWSVWRVKENDRKQRIGKEEQATVLQIRSYIGKLDKMRYFVFSS